MSYHPDNKPMLIVNDCPFASAYSFKSRVSISFPENSPHTKQEFKAEADINTIMARYNRTGELPQINLVAPQYLDVTDMDFHEHMNIIREAQDLFDALPSQVRNRFANDPGEFIDFCGDSNNHPELARMGLLSTEATRAILTPAPNTNVAPASVSGVPPAAQGNSSSLPSSQSQNP
jgi:phage internal scaffolding protein